MLAETAFATKPSMNAVVLLELFIGVDRNYVMLLAYKVVEYYVNKRAEEWHGDIILLIYSR